jgi:hypothetical protein
MTASPETLEIVLSALSTAGAGKVFIEVADSMPDPGPNANYFVRWFYAFMQKLASNSTKAEAARSGGKVVIESKIPPAVL